MRNVQGDPMLETPQEFAGRVGLKFKDKLLLSRALTHRSYLNENPDAIEDNERLEFLGDAVLDFVVGAWLYNRFPEMAEGELTRMRAALVRTEQLGAFGNAIQLGKAIRLGRGEEDGGGRSRLAMLCASFEAVVGALYLDQGIGPVEEFVNPLLEPAVRSILENHGDRDPKSILQEWAQAQGFRPPQYRIVKEDGPDHEKTFIVEVFIDNEPAGQGEGHSKQFASKEAAKAAMKNLDL
jgi:ribonuclease-3